MEQTNSLNYTNRRIHVFNGDELQRYAAGLSIKALGEIRNMLLISSQIYLEYCGQIMYWFPILIDYSDLLRCTVLKARFSNAVYTF